MNTIKPLSVDFRSSLHGDREKEPPCKGLFFRCEITSYIGSDRDVNFKTRFRFLKRMSCPGCAQCGAMWDDLREGLCDPKYSNVIFESGQIGELYQLKVTNISTDWETGYVDDYDLEFVRVEEKK